MFSPNPAVPQVEYFRQKWKLPSNKSSSSDWTLTGHSRALERTGFWIPELRMMLDAGVDLPTNGGGSPRAIFITHGHIDHMNALPMLLRHTGANDPPVHVFAPGPIMHRLRQYTQLSWAVKVDDGEDLPDDYASPPESEREFSSSAVYTDCRNNQWHATQSGDSTTIHLGKKSNITILVRSLRMFHGRCSTNGYLFCTPAGSKRILKPEFQMNDKKVMGQAIKAARQRGEETHIEVAIPEVPHLAFCLDTTVDALLPEKSETAEAILSCPTIIVECSYLEESKNTEATKRGHICWAQLLFIVQNQKASGRQTTWVLVHFSLRYSDNDIRDFFLSPDQCKVSFSTENAFGTTPDVVLWLDSGVVELWLKEG